MRIGYKRVVLGTKVDTERLCKRLNVERVYVDEYDDTKSPRTNLNVLLAFAREGDIIIVDSMYEVANRSREFLKLIDKLTTKGVYFCSLAEHFDTTTPAGKQAVIVCIALSNLDRQFALNYKVPEARMERRGRKEIPIDADRFAMEYDLWRKGGQTSRDVMEKFGLAKTTFYRKVREYEALHRAELLLASDELNNA